MKTYPIVLSIAGSDSTGEAGIQSAIKAISGLSAYAATVTTCIAVRSGIGVKAVHEIPPEIIREQIEAVMENMWPDVVVIGLVGSVEAARVIADCLRKYHPKYVVFEPIMRITPEKNVPDNETIKVIKDELLQYTNLMTINVAEAEVYAGTKIVTKNDMKETARILAEKYRIPVLLKGANLLENNTYDTLHIPDGENYEYIGNKLTYTNIHNISIIFTNAIATFLAYGKRLNEAIKNAREFVDVVEHLDPYGPIVIRRDDAGIPIPIVTMETYDDGQ